MPKPRIIAGRARGRPLETPRSGTRPTPARVREALFDILAFNPRGLFLDLYAGSGALGLEAASRGWRVVCVDRARQATAVIARNARTLGLDVEVRTADAIATAQALRGGVDVCSAAPPYPLDLPAIFNALLASACVRAGGVYVFQHPTAHPPALELPAGMRSEPARRYGSNSLTLVRVDSDAP